MKKNSFIKVLAVAVAACLACVVFAACGGPDPIELTLKETASTYIGESTTLRVTPSRDLVDGESYAWTSDKENVATVDQKGKVTGVSAGTAVITVSVGDVSASCTVTVTKRIKFNLAEEDAAVALNAEDDEHKTHQLTPTCNECADGACTAVAYEVDKPEFASVSETGLITALVNTTARKQTVTVTAKAHGLTATSTVTVTNPSADDIYQMGLGNANANVVKEPGRWFYFNKTSDGAAIATPEASFSSTKDEGDNLYVSYAYIGEFNTAGQTSQNYLRYQPELEIGTQYIFSCSLTSSAAGYITIGDYRCDLAANVPSQVTALQTVTANMPLNIRLYVFGGTAEEPANIELAFEGITFTPHAEHAYDETTHLCVCGTDGNHTYDETTHLCSCGKDGNHTYDETTHLCSCGKDGNHKYDSETHECSCGVKDPAYAEESGEEDAE